jgi:hypothetical protein
VTRGKYGVSLKPPDLHRPHNLVRDWKSSEARRALLGWQKARCCQANHKEIACQRGPASDGRSTFWYTERIKQFLTDFLGDFPGGTYGPLRIGHDIYQVTSGSISG